MQCFIKVAHLLNSGLTPAARKIKDDCRAIGHVASEKFAAKLQTVVRSLPLLGTASHMVVSAVDSAKYQFLRKLFDLSCVGLQLISFVVNSD